MSQQTATSDLKRLKNKIHTDIRENLEEILEVKTFFKMFIGFKCRGPKLLSYDFAHF